MKFIANFLSGVLHPLLLPTYIFSLIFFVVPEIISPINPSVFLTLFLIISVSTCIIPVFIVVIMYKFNIVKKINIEDRKDRFIPQVISCLIYSFVTWLFYSKIPQVPTLYLIMTSITICMIIVTTTNFFWKISAHSTGMGGLVSFITFCTYFYGEETLLLILGLTIIFSGFVMASRLYLHVHTIGQVCAGFMVGLIAGLGVLSNIS